MSGMGHYRLYFLDDRGRIRRPVNLECECDEEAIALANEHPHDHGMELWQGARLVRRIPTPRPETTI